MSPSHLPPPLHNPRHGRKGKEIPRLPLSAFSPPNTGTSDSFAIPPTPSFISPTGVVDSQLQVNVISTDVYKADTSHLESTTRKGVVLTARGLSAEVIIASREALQSSVPDVRVLSVLIPFSVDNQAPGYFSTSATFPAALTTAYNGAIPVAPEAEEENKDHAQVEIPVGNLSLALQYAKVVDINVEGDIMSSDSTFYDNFINLLTKATRVASQSTPEGKKRATIVLTNVLPPPLESTMAVVTMMNHPSYTLYRQRVSLLSLFENVHMKLLPPQWLTAGPATEVEIEGQIRNLIKLFVVPVIEAFGFERIIFGSAPVSDTSASPTRWYKLILDSLRELAVGQDEMDKIFMENAERVYAA